MWIQVTFPSPCSKGTYLVDWGKKLSSIFSVSLNPIFVSCHFAVGFHNMLCDFTGLVKCKYSNLKICMFPSVPWGYFKRGDSETGEERFHEFCKLFPLSAFFTLEWRLRITYTIHSNLMRYTIKTICCSLCISIPMLSLSIFPSLPFRAVEVLSCDITLHRGKLESPARCFTPLVSSQRICFGHKCSFTTCVSPLPCMLNMVFQWLKIQWLSAESEFELIASVFVWHIFSPNIDL